MVCDLRVVVVKRGQLQMLADLVAGVSRKEERHPSTAQVPFVVLLPRGRVDLRVGVDVTHTWEKDVHMTYM